MFSPIRLARAFASKIYARAYGLRHGIDLFDREFYSSEYPDVAASGLDPMAHYLLYGAREGRQPHPMFDSQFYLSEYADVAASGENPFVHYMRRGWKEDRRPAPFLDPIAYRERHGLGRDRNPLFHYTAEVRAGRTPRVVPDLKELRPAARAAAHAGRPVILFITHRLKGGVDEYSNRVRDAIGDRASVLTLKPACCGMTVLESDHAQPIWIDTQDGLAELLRSFGVSRVHLQHWKGHRLDVASLIRDLGVPFDFTIHDYFAACPQVTMTDAQGRYCGEPDDEGCNACIRERPCAAPDIAAWRAASRGVVQSAERVIAPCPDAAARFARYFPAARLVTAPHPEANAVAEPRPVPVLANEPLRVAVLGSMVAHKGLAKLTECAALSKQRALPLEFRLIGEARGRHSFPFHQTGQYAPGGAGRLLAAFNPHVVWFPGEAPETYSFTLSLCLERGLPVAAPRIGCFPERLAGRRHTWVVPHDWSAENWLRFFSAVRAGDPLAEYAAERLTAPPGGARDFYEARYLE